MEKIFLDATANQHPLKYDAINKSRNPEVLCKHNLLNFKVLKIDTNTASDYIECWYIILNIWDVLEQFAAQFCKT